MNSKRVFLLGPSHHHYLSGAATTKFDIYDTPLGGLPIDKELVQQLAKDWNLEIMSTSVDEAEHSLEMHLPYIYKMLSKYSYPTSPTSHNADIPNRHFETELPPLVPIMVGNTSPATERSLGQRLAPYLSDPNNIFVISSDFCHWGSRFRYTYYQPSTGSPQNLRSSSSVPKSRPIHESIAAVDLESMDAVETGSHNAFLEQLEETGNTVCGRHPIGVFMAAVEAAELGGEGKGRFKFLRYERSGLVDSVRDSSVSYASAFAVF